jgi:hypothetical protein
MEFEDEEFNYDHLLHCECPVYCEGDCELKSRTFWEGYIEHDTISFLDKPKTLTQLRCLEFSCVKIQSPGIFPRISEFLTRTEILHRFSLMAKDITIEDVTSLSSALVINTSIKQLGLEFKHLKFDKNSPLVGALAQNTRIEHLQIAPSNFVENGFSVITKGMLANTSLKTLILDGRIFCVFPYFQTCNSFLSKTVTLRRLILDHIRMTRDDFLDFSKILEKNQSMTDVNLNGLDINSEVILEIMKSITYGSVIRNFGIGFSHVTDFPGEEIANLLAINTKLKSLSLQNLTIGDDNAASMIRGLLLNTTLEDLSLRHNQIKKNGGLAIAEVLSVNTTLSRLDLSSNNILYARDHIVFSLENNPSIVYFNTEVPFDFDPLEPSFTVWTDDEINKRVERNVHNLRKKDETLFSLFLYYCEILPRSSKRERPFLLIDELNTDDKFSRID